MAGPSNSLLFLPLRGSAGTRYQENLLSCFHFCLRHTPSSRLTISLSLLHLFIYTMDEIAPEYDVVVLGTGKLLATPPFFRAHH